jgi:hypothetical protein
MRARALANKKKGGAEIIVIQLNVWTGEITYLQARAPLCDRPCAGGGEQGPIAQTRSWRFSEPVRHVAERQLALLWPAGEFWQAGIFAGWNQRSNKR